VEPVSERERPGAVARRAARASASGSLGGRSELAESLRGRGRGWAWAAAVQAAAAVEAEVPPETVSERQRASESSFSACLVNPAAECCCCCAHSQLSHTQRLARSLQAHTRTHSNIRSLGQPANTRTSKQSCSLPADARTNARAHTWRQTRNAPAAAQRQPEQQRRRRRQLRQLTVRLCEQRAQY